MAKQLASMKIIVDGVTYESKSVELDIEAASKEMYALMGAIDKFTIVLKDDSVILLPIETVRRAVFLFVPVPKYGCFCDLDPDMQPDDCVLDENAPDDCIYARGLDKKENCKYWKKIE